MAIRRISDLPYLTQEQMNIADEGTRERFLRSGLELSYISSMTAGNLSDETVYTSRFIELNQLTDLIVSDVMYGDIALSGDKTFTGKVSFDNGIDVGNHISLTGNLNINSKSSYSRLSGDMRFADLKITTTNGIVLSPSAKVDRTISSDNKSVVNVGYLADWMTKMEELVNAKLRYLDSAIIEISSRTFDYNTVWPVGAIYIAADSTSINQISALVPGSSWTKIQGRYLLASGNLNGTDETYSAGGTVNAGAPTVTASASVWGSGRDDGGSYFTFGNKANSTHKITMQTASGDSVYGKSNTIRPPAIAVDVWKRIS